MTQHTAHRVWSGILSDIQQVKWCNPKVQRSYLLPTVEFWTTGNESVRGCTGNYAPALPHSYNHSVIQILLETLEIALVRGRQTCQEIYRVSLWLAPKQEQCSDTHQFALHHSALFLYPPLTPTIFSLPCVFIFQIRHQQYSPCFRLCFLKNRG